MTAAKDHTALYLGAAAVAAAFYFRAQIAAALGASGTLLNTSWLAYPMMAAQSGGDSYSTGPTGTTPPPAAPPAAPPASTGRTIDSAVGWSIVNGALVYTGNNTSGIQPPAAAPDPGAGRFFNPIRTGTSDPIAPRPVITPAAPKNPTNPRGLRGLQALAQALPVTPELLAYTHRDRFTAQLVSLKQGRQTWRR